MGRLWTSRETPTSVVHLVFRSTAAQCLISGQSGEVWMRCDKDEANDCIEKKLRFLVGSGRYGSIQMTHQGSWPARTTEDLRRERHLPTSHSQVRAQTQTDRTNGLPPK